MQTNDTEEFITIIRRKKKRTDEINAEQYRQMRLREYYPVITELNKKDHHLIQEHNKICSSEDKIFCECCCSNKLTDILKKHYRCNGCFCCTYPQW